MARLAGKFDRMEGHGRFAFFERAFGLAGQAPCLPEIWLPLRWQAGLFGPNTW
jgi:hypothetical protein